jgi:DNA replication protein DnaC
MEKKMSYEQTIEKMKAMHLHGMARSFQATSEMGFTKLTPDELVAMLIDAEHDERNNKKLARLLSAAKLRYRASMEHIDFQFKRNLDKNQIMRFATSNWLDKKQNIIITGSTGCGKSYIACALGHNACIHGRSVCYFNSSKLFKSLKLANADGTYLKEINRIKKIDLLIIDDFGMEPFDKQSRLSLLEIIEDRYDEKSMILTSQFPASSWHEMIGEKTIADAICDRLLHSAHRIELKGESLRKKFTEVLT